MDISCLENYIGAKNIADQPTSGRFINDLAGITTDRIDQTYDQDDNYDVESAWDAIERNAIRKFYAKLSIWAKKYYLNYSYMVNVITGQYMSNTAVPVSDEYKGVFFDFQFTSYKNIMLQITSVNIYARTVASQVTIYAFNTSTGERLFDKVVDLVVGDNRINLGWSIPVWRYGEVFICYDASEIETIEHDSYGFSALDSIDYKKIPKGGSVVTGNLSASGKQNGLIVTYNLDCSLDNFVCNRLELFEEAFMYCIAAETLHQSIHSEEINRYTLLDFERANLLLEQYQEEFVEQMSAVLKGLKIQDDSLCFVCNRAINHRTMLP